GFICRRQIQTMVIGHAVAVSLGVVKHRSTSHLVLATRKRHSVVRVEYIRSPPSPLLRKLLHAHLRYIVCTFLTSSKPLSAIDTVKLPLTFGQSITYPAV